jgi:HlyD family secretion protein
MKRLIVPLIIAALALTAFWYRDRWLPQPPGSNNYLGYVEGETILVGAPQAGRLVKVDAVKGQGVEAGTVLFALDPAQAETEVARAEAAVRTADASYVNLLSGKREPEITMIRAQIDQVNAALDLARKELQRATMLANSGTAAQSREDAAITSVQSYEARLRELQAAIDVAQLPGRESEIAAAKSRVEEAKAAADTARQKLADLSPEALRAAAVEDVFFKTGEWVSAGQSVVSLQAADDITLRFYVPEQALSAASPGTRVSFHCDGCGNVRSATVTKVSAEPEYTPPVIYSEGARAKLVYLVEARPGEIDAKLRPGLPIEVEPLQ